MQESDIAKTYVMSDNTAVLICPYCTHWKKISVEPFRGYKHKPTVKCFCKQTFKVFLEFRKKVRKKSFLRGTYTNHAHKGSKCDIVILDISVIGLAFSSLDAPTFNVGDELSVEVAFDIEQRTDIRRDVIVRNIRKKRVGCEFEIYGGDFDGPFGYYVMS